MAQWLPRQECLFGSGWDQSEGLGLETWSAHMVQPPSKGMETSVERGFFFSVTCFIYYYCRLISVSFYPSYTSHYNINTHKSNFQKTPSTYIISSLITTRTSVYIITFSAALFLFNAFLLTSFSSLQNAENQESQEYRGVLGLSLKYVPPEAAGTWKSTTWNVYYKFF